MKLGLQISSSNRTIGKFAVVGLSALLAWNGSTSLTTAAPMPRANYVQQDYEVMTVAPKFDIPVISEGDPRDVQTEKRAQQSAARAALREAGNELREIARGARSFSDGFSEYVRDYWIASMTQTDQASLAEMGKRRTEMLRVLFPTEGTPAYRQQLIESLLLPSLQNVVEKNFHPSARLNAVTLIGLLNNAEGGSSAAPVPNLPAFRYLLTSMENDSLPLYVRVGAISGLQRVAQIHGVRPLLDEAEVNRLTTISLALLSNSVAGQGAWTTDAAYWMKRRAVQTLGGLRRSGNNGEVTKGLNSVLGDKEQPLWLRYDALTALSQLKHANPATAFVSDTVYNMAALAGESSLQEAIQVRADLEELIALNLMLSNTSLQKIGDSKRGPEKPSMGTGGVAGDGPGGDEGTGGQGSSESDGPPVIEMPTYYLNAVRKKAKTFSALSQSALKEKNFQEFATADEKKVIEAAVKVLDRLFKESDVGLRDQSKDEEPPKTGGDQTKATTNKLIAILKSAGDDLIKIAESRPKADGAPPAEGGN